MKIHSRISTGLQQGVTAFSAQGGGTYPSLLLKVAWAVARLPKTRGSFSSTAGVLSSDTSTSNTSYSEASYQTPSCDTAIRCKMNSPPTCSVEAEHTLWSPHKRPCLEHKPLLEKLPPSVNLLQKHLAKTLSSQKAFKQERSVACFYMTRCFSIQVAAGPVPVQGTLLQGHGYMH